MRTSGVVFLFSASSVIDYYVVVQEKNVTCTKKNILNFFQTQKSAAVACSALHKT